MALNNQSLLRGLRLQSRIIQTTLQQRQTQSIRNFSKNTTTPTVPNPTPFVPDVSTFLTLIGRQMSKHSNKITSWNQLFNSTSNELRDLGIEPARSRRYLIRKREKFRNGIYGPGGDLENVVDGVAQLRVVEIPASSTSQGRSTTPSAPSATLTPGMKKAIVNLPPDALSFAGVAAGGVTKFAFDKMKVHRGSKIQGPFLKPLKGSHGSAATISVTEGMWEDKRGVKVDGGERRRVEVRAKKRLDERRKA